jgi:hypothetical protein
MGMPKRFCHGHSMACATPAIRLWWQVSQLGANECWPWTGRCDTFGYGRIGIERKEHPAHRVAYELTRGPIPDGICVLHHCDHPACCNPAHLFLGTKKDNTQDMIAKGRHRFFGENPRKVTPTAKL